MASTEYRSRIKSIKSKDLGKYQTENGRIKAELRLSSTDVGMVNPWYAADFNFYTDIQYEGETEGFSVRTHYTSNAFAELFNRVKRGSAGIELILAKGMDPNWDFQCATDVVACILDLEKQTKHIPSELENSKNK